jgi:iron(III) transport system substrate-binding protein
LNRRTLLVGLGASLLAPAARAELLDAARKEGTLTWYIAQVDSEAAIDLARRFTAANPGIAVSAVRTTGQVAYQRLLLEMQCDVFSTTDISQIPTLKERNVLLRYEPPNAAGLLPMFRQLSDPGFYYANSATNHFLIHNTNKVPAAEAPHSWTDLLDVR